MLKSTLAFVSLTCLLTACASNAGSEAGSGASDSGVVGGGGGPTQGRDAGSGGLARGGLGGYAGAGNGPGASGNSGGSAGSAAGGSAGSAAGAAPTGDAGAVPCAVDGCATLDLTECGASGAGATVLGCAFDAAGGCLTWASESCDDENPCTDDGCANGACTTTDNTDSCDDGDATTANDTCAGGACAGTPILCPVTQCFESSTPNGVDCTDVPKPSGTPCDDGDLATGPDTCDGSGACVGKTITCTPNQCQLSSTPNGSGCTVVDKPATTSCDDGDPATRNDECDGSGTCAGTPYTCNPGTCEDSSTENGVDCTVVYSALGTGCNDGNNSTRNDACDGSGNCAGQAYTCPYPTLCETSVTPNGVDCTHVKKADGTSCDDAETCTTPDTCQDGVCVGGSLCGNGSCDAICGEHAGTCAADCQTSSGECGTGENACTNWAGCHTVTTGDGLCANIGCGTGQVGNCFCDPGCIQYNDCCQDMQAVCGCP